MSIYVFVNLEEVTDPEPMMEYAEKVPAIIEQFGGEYLVRGDQSEVIEGTWKPGFVVVLRFPSEERARAFYDSDAYRPYRLARERASRSSVVMLPAAA
ncbi:MAG: DUF1330 domain-containing protein [Dehalococcoidia bacterium]|nr:DUF1330 domain-containing protein [Dehalococcoidia bacterium]